MGSPQPEDEHVRLQYQEVCRSYHAITDFRGKLLALLPFASGAAIGILVSHNVDRSYLTAFGLLGFATTSGLFIHELRGIQYCLELEATGQNLERAMDLAPGMGQFLTVKPGRLGNFIGARGAAVLVYPAVLFAWVYLSGVPTTIWNLVPAWLLILPYVIIVAALFKWTAGFDPNGNRSLKLDLRTARQWLRSLRPRQASKD